MMRFMANGPMMALAVGLCLEHVDGLEPGCVGSEREGQELMECGFLFQGLETAEAGICRHTGMGTIL